MSRRGPRGLSPEEQALWEKVKERTAALHPERQKPENRPYTTPKPPPVRENPRVHIPQFRIGEQRSDTAMPNNLAASLPATLGTPPIRMDQKQHTRLKRGKLTPEARIDLPGMTLDQAHGALNGFILDAHAQGRRLVLVITGKGKQHRDDGPIPVRRGALKHLVPQWLNGPGLSQAVLQISEAHQKHGGSGAYYVYLRRIR